MSRPNSSLSSPELNDHTFKGRVKRFSGIRPESSATLYDRAATPTNKSKDELNKSTSPAPTPRPTSSGLAYNTGNSDAILESDAEWVPSHPRKPYAQNASESGVLMATGPTMSTMPSAPSSLWGFKPSQSYLTPENSTTMANAPPRVDTEKAAAGADLTPSTESFIKRHRWWVAGLLFILALAIGLGAGLGAGLSHHHNPSNTAVPPVVSHSHASTGPTASSTTAAAPVPSATGPPLDSSGNDPTKINALAQWKWSNPQSKALGVSFGNWLVHERWIDEDWWTSHAPNAMDEWTFHETLGAGVTNVLDEYMTNFINETDVELLWQYGINMVRIPAAYWFWVPTQGNEPYINGTQLDHLTQMMGWLWKRGMRAVIDLHQLMGSQSGDQASGQATSNPQWFNSTNQARSDVLIKALVDWLEPHPYRSVIAAVTPVNEPNGPLGATPSHLETVADFYKRTYPVLSAANLTMFFHHGFAGNPTQYWQDFATGKNPDLLVFNDNPYPGFYPAKNTSQQAYSAVCQNANQYTSFPVPTVKTEWSLINGIVGNSSWNQEYFQAQASAYGWSGGSFFWSYKVMNSTHPVSAAPNIWQVQWSFLTQLQMGNVPRAQQGVNAQHFLQSLPNQPCGKDPSLTWSNPSTSH